MNHFIRIQAEEGELEAIFKELIEAQEKIFKCYSRLKEYGILTITKKADSGN